MSAVQKLNAAIARASFMTNGKIGQDWRSGRPFVAADKGSEWEALKQCLDAMRAARSEIEILASITSTEPQNGAD